MAKKFNLSVVISAVDRATAPVRKISKNMQRMSRTIARVNNRLRAMARAAGLVKLSGAMRNAAGSAKALGKSLGVAGLKLAAIGAGVALFVRNTTQAGDQLAKISRRVGVSVETLSRFSLAAERAGINQETFARGLRNVARNADQARRGTGESLLFFKKLGIEYQKSNGDLRDTEDILKDIAEEFKNMPDGPEKTVAAMRLLGEEAGPLMINMLNEGSAGLDKMARRAEELGVVLSTKDAVAMEKFNDAIADVGSALQGIAQAITIAVLPALKPLVDKVIAFVVANRKVIATQAVDFLKDFGAAALDIFKAFQRVAKVLIPLVEFLGGPGKAIIIALAVFIGGPMIASVIGFVASLVSVVIAMVPVLITVGSAIISFGALAISVLAAALPILAIIVAVGLLVLIFKNMNDAVQAAGGWGLVWEGFKITVQETVDAVVSSIKKVIRWIGEASKAASEKLGIFKFLIPGGPALDLLSKLAPDEANNALPANTDPLNTVGGAAANGQVDLNVRFENAPAGTRADTKTNGEGLNLTTDMGIALATQ